MTNKTHRILLSSLFIALFFNSYCQNSLKNRIFLSHDQYMVTYDGAFINDIVGVFDPWFPSADTTNGTFQYSIVKNKNDIYSIDQTSGIITINNNLNLESGVDTLVVKTVLHDKSEDYNVWIFVKPESECLFIDPYASTNGNGSRTSPFNSWESISFEKNKAYLQKRETTYTKRIDINNDGALNQEIFMAAYGSGSRPVISCGHNISGISVSGSYIKFFELNLSNNEYGIYVQHDKLYTNLFFSDLTFYNNAINGNGQLYFSKVNDNYSIDEYFWDHKVFDIIASGDKTGEAYGIKVEGPLVHIENMQAYNMGGQGISLPTHASRVTITGLLSYNNNSCAIELSGKYHNLSYSILRGGYRAIVIDDTASHSSIINNCLIEGTSGASGITLRGNTGNISYARNFIIEDCEIRGVTSLNSAGITIAYATDNTIIRRNKIHSCFNGINIGENYVSVDSVLINNNILYDNLNTDILGIAGYSIWLYNNTIDGTINLTGTASEIVTNNFFRKLIGAGESSNNLNIDSLNTLDYFYDYQNRNFNLLYSAVKAIDKGKNVGITLDYDKNLIPFGNAADIGAYESIRYSPSDSLPNKPYDFSGQALAFNQINLNWKDNSDNEYGFIIERNENLDSEFQKIHTTYQNIESYTDNNIQSKSTYYYRIRTYNNIGYSDYAEIISVTAPQQPPPNAPTLLKIFTVNSKNVHFIWNDNSSNELGFIIERSDGNAESFRQVATVKANVKEYINSSLTPNTSYYYRIKAYNEDGQSDYSNVLSVTTLALQLPAAPNGLNASGITKSSFNLTWNDNSNNESGFQIYKLVDSTGSYKLFKTTTTNIPKLEVSGLQPNTSHTFRVRAYNDDGVSGYSNILKVTTLPLQPPVAPITLKPDSITPTEVIISWQDRSDNETGFYIYRSLAETSGYQLLHTNGQNHYSYINSNLDQGKTYYYRVRAYNEDGVSSYTNILKITTLNPPRSPTGLLLKNVSKTSATIEWSDKASNESGFFIERSLNTPGQFTRIDTLKTDSTFYVNTNLKPNTVYYYRIIAFNNDGQSLPSDTLRIQTEPLIIPASPSNLTLEKIYPFRAEISWQDNSTNENGFQLQRADSTLNFVNLKNLTSGNTTYKDTTLADNSVYYYRIRAYNNDGYSKFSDTLMIKTPANIIPLEPQNLKPELVKYDKVILTWESHPNGTTGFEVERAPDTTGKFVLIAKTGLILSYTDTSVTEGESYTYRIRAFNIYNFSGYSTEITVEIPFLLLPEPPELLSPETIESNSITLKWKDKSNDESGFIVKRAVYPNNDFEPLHTLKTNDTLYVDSTVTPSTTYYYLVNALNENGLSENSNKLRVSSLSLAETARWHEGLIAYYNFSLNSDSVIHDLSGVDEPVNLLITDTTNTNWQNNSRLEILNPTLIRSLKPAEKIVKFCKETNEITLECWIKPLTHEFSGESCIISLSGDEENVGFSLMNEYSESSPSLLNKYYVGLSTKSTTSDGRPYLFADENTGVTLHHVVYTRNQGGEEKIYLNGKLISTGIKPLGINNWDNKYYLYLGNNHNLLKPWKGTFYLTAIYNIALTQDQVLQNFEAGPTDNIIKPKDNYEISAYPNPSSGKFNFKITPLDKIEYGESIVIQLIDLNSFIYFEFILRDSEQEHILEMNLSDLKKGIYYIKTFSKSFVQMQKVILY